MLRVFESQGVPLTTFQREGGDLNAESEYEVLLMLQECYSKKIVTPADQQWRAKNGTISPEED